MHITFVVVYLLLCFILFEILDKVKANRIKALKFELEQNLEEEDALLSNKEKALLEKGILWSRIRFGLGIIMFIGFIFIFLLK